MQSPHFPVMPPRKRPWSSSINSDIDELLPEPAADEPAAKHIRTTPPMIEDSMEIDIDHIDLSTRPILHTCPTCHAYFLSLVGLILHQQAAHSGAIPE